MSADRADDAETDEDGGGGDEEYEIGVEMNYGEMLIR